MTHVLSRVVAALRRALRRRPAALTGAMALVAACATVLAPAPARAEQQTASTITAVSELGGASVFRAGPDRINVQPYGSDGFTVSAYRGPNSNSGYSGYSFTFNALPGEPSLAVGSYTDTKRSRTDGHAGFDISGYGSGCNKVAGRFDVLDFAPDLSRFHIRYEAHCEGWRQAQFGEIRWNEPADSDVQIAPTGIRWPDRNVGETSRKVPVTLFNTGSQPLTISRTAVEGAAAGDFPLLGTCGTIAPGGSCAVDVGFVPAKAGDRTGNLTFTDSSAAGSHSVSLRGSAGSEPPNPLPAADPTVTPLRQNNPGEPPPYLFAPTAQGDRAWLTWSNPDSAEWVRTVIRGARGLTPPAQPTDGFAVYSGTGSSALTESLPPGDAYTFTAFAYYLDSFRPATYARLDGGRIVVQAPSAVGYGRAVRVSGQVTGVFSTVGAGVKVTVLRRDRQSGAVTTLGTPLTDSRGVFYWDTTAERAFDYLASFDGDAAHLPALPSNAVPVYVGALMTVTPDQSEIALGQTVVFATDVAPAAPGQWVLLQVFNAQSRWLVVARAQLDANGHAAIQFKPTARDLYTLRVHYPGTDQILPATSDEYLVTVS